MRGGNTGDEGDWCAMNDSSGSESSPRVHAGTLHRLKRFPPDTRAKGAV
jgi:hypothetical protein